MTAELRKLPFGATFVVWWARMLRPGEKIVWNQTWALDISKPGTSNGDHCYMSAASLADRVGMSPYTVEDYRSALVHFSLLRSFRRQGATNHGWVCILPDGCEPRTANTAGAEAAKYGQALDAHIDSQIQWLVAQGRWDPDDLSDRRAAARRVYVRRRPGVESGASSEAQVAPLGGRGEIPSSVSRRQAKLLPAVRKDGVVARATSRRMDFERNGGPLTPEEMADFRSSLDRQVRNGTMTRENADRLIRVSGL